ITPGAGAFDFARIVSLAAGEVDGEESLFALGERIRGGERSVGRWDGAGWEPVGPALGAGARDLEIFPIDGVSRVVVGGQGRVGSSFRPELHYWDGAEWRLRPGLGGDGISVLKTIETPQGLRLAAGGQITSAAGGPAGGIALYDGEQWERLAEGVGAHVTAITTVGGRIFAAGDLGVPGERYLLAAWEQGAW